MYLRDLKSQFSRMYHDTKNVPMKWIKISIKVVKLDYFFKISYISYLRNQRRE